MPGWAGCWGLQARGSMGRGAAAPASSHPVPPGTGTHWVCPARSSGAIPVAVPGGELQAQGTLAGPTQMLVCWGRSRATTVGSCRHAQPRADLPAPLGAGSQEGCPTPPGRSTTAQPGENQPRHEEPLAHRSPLCQGRVGFSLPCHQGQQRGH